MILLVVILPFPKQDMRRPVGRDTSLEPLVLRTRAVIRKHDIIVEHDKRQHAFQFIGSKETTGTDPTLATSIQIQGERTKRGDLSQSSASRD